MSIVTLAITSIALAMDAFAVSLATGLASKEHVRQNSIRCGIAFGFFQSAMTAIGWLVGRVLYTIIQPIDHWVAFVLLTFIGGKMIYDARKIEALKPLIQFHMLLALALVTSIDALAAGLSFSSLGIPILMPAVLIGCVTFVLSYGGVRLGAVLSNVEKLEKYADILGGIVLIGIGINTLITHLMLGV